MASVSLMRLFTAAAEASTGQSFGDYEALHRWSVTDAEAFWKFLWEFEGVLSDTPYEAVLESRSMPGARWFPGSTLNYARQVFRHVDAADAAGHPAIISEDETGAITEVGWPDLRARVASLAAELRLLDVESGDRIAAYLPNRTEAVVAFLACASIGAVWTVCAPDMGAPAILDRFRQIEPKLLIAADGVFYGGKAVDRAPVVRQLHDALPTVEKLVVARSGYSADRFEDALDFSALCARTDCVLEPTPLPFDHPLWIVYSSGTTGKPKALVHGHGGMILGSAATRLHSDLGASYDARTPGERFHWFSSTGWMMWNTQVGGLLGGTTICIYDGNPMGSREAPDWGVLWRFAARHRVTFFGSGAQFYALCAKSGLDLASVGDLSSLRALGSTASPLPAAVQLEISKRLCSAGTPDIWWFNSSGGTDICGAFCTGNRDLPEAPGKLQCRQIGAAVEAWDEAGIPVLDVVGELVCTQALPNMPLYLVGDADGARYRESYFDIYPGIWRHGDWLRIASDGSCEIFGRSDATINRGGHRMGTSEIYDAVEQLDAVADSMVIDVRQQDADSKLLLFVVPAGGELTGELADAVRGAIRTSLSPRFIPDSIIPVTDIPRTLTSKKLELPVKRLFEGHSGEELVDSSTMSNPDSLREYIAIADRLSSGSGV